MWLEICKVWWTYQAQGNSSYSHSFLQNKTSYCFRENILVWNHLNVTYAAELSPDQTILLYMWRDTWTNDIHNPFVCVVMLIKSSINEIYPCIHFFFSFCSILFYYNTNPEENNLKAITQCLLEITTSFMDILYCT